MPRSFLFPSVPGTSRLVELSANTALTVAHLGALVSLNGFTLTLSPLAASAFGVVFVTGPGNVAGALAAVLGASDAVIVAVKGEEFDFAQASVSSVAGKTGAVVLTVDDIGGLADEIESLTLGLVAINTSLGSKASVAALGDESAARAAADAALSTGKLPVPVTGTTAAPISSEGGQRQGLRLSLSSGGTASSDGDLLVNVTILGSLAIGITVPILAGDTSSVWGGKVAAALLGFPSLVTVESFSTSIYLYRTLAAAHDPTFQLTVTNAPDPDSPGIVNRASIPTVDGVAGTAGTPGVLGQEYVWGERMWICTRLSPVRWTEVIEADHALPIDGTRVDTLTRELALNARTSAGLTRRGGGSIPSYDPDSRADIVVTGVLPSYLSATWVPRRWLSEEGFPSWGLAGTNASISRNHITRRWEISAGSGVEFTGNTTDLDYPWLENSWAFGSAHAAPPVLTPSANGFEERLLREFIPREAVPVLTDAATIVYSIRRGRLAKLTLAGNRTLAFPSHLEPGTYLIRVTQDDTGGRTLAFAEGYLFADGIPPVLSTAPDAVDLITLVAFDATAVHVGIARNQLAAV